MGVTRYWRFSKETMQELYSQGRIVQTSPGTVPRQSAIWTRCPAFLQDLWLDVKPVQSQSTESLSYVTQKPEGAPRTYHQARLQRQRPHPRLLLRLRHDAGGRRETRPPLDRLRPRPLRRPHHPQAPAQHRRRQAVSGAEPRQVRAAAVAGWHILARRISRLTPAARRDAGTGGDCHASTPTSSSASTTRRRCPAGRCCTASRTAGSSTSAASRRR